MGLASVIWSPEALEERDAHYGYIAAHAGPAAAYAVLRRIMKAAAQLSVFPRAGAVEIKATESWLCLACLMSSTTR